MTRRLAILALAAALLALGAPTRAAEPVGATVGLVPSTDGSITAALADGARLALERARDAGGPRLALVLGRKRNNWSSAAQTGVRLVSERRAVALITPPERAAAHALAQVGTRCQIPVVSTSSAPTVTRTGSTWVVSVVPRAPEASAASTTPAFDPGAAGAAAFVRSFEKRYGRAPTAWNAVGYDAASVVVAGVRRGRPILRAVTSGDPVRGAAGRIRFDRLGSPLARRSRR